MICPNCGNKLSENEVLCSNCGNKISEIKEQIVDINKNNYSQEVGATISRVTPKKDENFIKNIMQKIRNFFAKYIKQCLIGVGGVAVLIVGFLLYNHLWE